MAFELRLKAYKNWMKMKEPEWIWLTTQKLIIKPCYYSAPKEKKKLKSLDEVDPELLKTYTKLVSH